MPRVPTKQLFADAPPIGVVGMGSSQFGHAYGVKFCLGISEHMANFVCDIFAVKPVSTQAVAVSAAVKRLRLLDLLWILRSHPTRRKLWPLSKGRSIAG